MVQRGGVLLLWFNLVEILDATMNPVMDLSGETLDDCPPRGARLPYDLATRCVNNLAHLFLLSDQLLWVALPISTTLSLSLDCFYSLMPQSKSKL